MPQSAWAAKLARPVEPAGHRLLHTLSDVRDFILAKVPEERQHFPTWQLIGSLLLDAAKTGEGVRSLTVALELVLYIEGRWEPRRG